MTGKYGQIAPHSGILPTEWPQNAPQHLISNRFRAPIRRFCVVKRTLSSAFPLILRIFPLWHGSCFSKWRNFDAIKPDSRPAESKKSWRFNCRSRGCKDCWAVSFSYISLRRIFTPTLPRRFLAKKSRETPFFGCGAKRRANSAPQQSLFHNRHNVRLNLPSRRISPPARSSPSLAPTRRAFFRIPSSCGRQSTRRPPRAHVR